MDNETLISIIREVFGITSPQVAEQKLKELSADELAEILSAYARKNTPVHFRTAA